MVFCGSVYGVSVVLECYAFYLFTISGEFLSLSNTLAINVTLSLVKKTHS